MGGTQKDLHTSTRGSEVGPATLPVTSSGPGPVVIPVLDLEKGMMCNFLSGDEKPKLFLRKKHVFCCK